MIMLPVRCFLIRILALSVVSFGFALSPSLQAQESAQIATQGDLANRGGTLAPEGTAPFRISDPALGEIDLVARTPRPKMFTVSTSQTFNFTTNAFLSQSGELDAFFWNGRFDVSFVPYAVRDFTPRLTFEQNFFRYSRFSRLDFDSQTLQLDLKYDLNRNDTWFIDGSYGGTRLYTPRGSDGEFYRYGLANLSLNHVLPIGHSPVYLLCTAGAYSRSGDSSAFDRIAPYTSVTALYHPIDQIQVSAYLRPELQFYTNDPLKSSRTDVNISLGGAVAWTPNQYVSIGASLAFLGNYSNAGGQSYNVFSPNIGVAAQISF
jgi:hypothetical protein